MANDNHEQYDGNDISTYTDVINNLNMMSPDFIDGCTLSAGLLPCDNPKIQVTSQQSFQQGPNSLSPFYFDGGGNLWFDETELSDATDSRFQYLHIVYAGISDNQIASSLKVQNYRNFVTITQHTETINGTPYNYYELGLTTKYGDNDDPDSTWTNSVLKPMYVIPDNNMRTGFFAEEVMCVQECDFAAMGTHGKVCTNLNYQQGRRNLIDGSGNFIEKAIWYAGLGLPQGYHINGGTQYGSNFDHHLQWQNNPSNFYAGSVINNEDDLLMLTAICGLKFEYNNVLYKPIVEGGVVTGYTSDMSETSEWDEWEDIGDHDIPIDPHPVPPPGPGYDDDPWNGATFAGTGVGGAGAFAKCYYMTSTELANLRSWMNSNNVPEGFDPMAQIIGLSQVPVSLSGDDNSTVQFVNSSAVYDPGVTRLVDSGVSTQIAMGTPIRYSLGSVDITRRMQERGEPYLDYDCQIELYLPLIGMFSLDTQAVMGRTITAEAVLDPISGTLAAYAYVSRDGQKLPIAYGSTTIGVDLPISSQQYSVSRAALKQANAQLGASILSSTLSFIAAATAGGKGSGTGAKTATGSTNGLAAAGIREAGADYMKASQAGNVFGDFMQWGRTIRQLSYGNNTAIAGSFGGSTAQWSYPFTPYVKIIRPRYEKPSNYAHSQGVPCVQTKSVGSCTGFIQCIGVDVSGITGATDIELQAIQSALANGVFAGGGA